MSDFCTIFLRGGPPPAPGAQNCKNCKNWGKKLLLGARTGVQKPVKISVFGVAGFPVLQICALCVFPPKQDTFGRKIDKKLRISGVCKLPEFGGQIFPDFPGFSRNFGQFSQIFRVSPGGGGVPDTKSTI